MTSIPDSRISREHLLSLPRISVVIPSYNQGEYLEDAILSVAGQGYTNLEILVMDGGSTDNSIEIIKRHEDSLAFWRSESDRGQADAINQGLKRAGGDILCWLNSDDMLLPGTLLDIANRFIESGKNTAPRLIYGAGIILNESGPAPDCAAFHSCHFDRDLLSYSDYIQQPSAFWNRSLWEETGELDIGYRYMLDWDWFIRASRKTDFEYTPRFYSFNRIHNQTKTRCGGEERRKEIMKVIREHAPPYWQDMYAAFNARRTAILSTHQLLRKIGMHGGRLLPYLFPEIWRLMHHWRDFFVVYGMLN